MPFVVYEKAFDSVETHSILEALQEQGINIKLIRDIYTDNFTTVCKTIDWTKKGYNRQDSYMFKLLIRLHINVAPSIQIKYKIN